MLLGYSHTHTVTSSLAALEITASEVNGCDRPSDLLAQDIYSLVLYTKILSTLAVEDMFQLNTLSNTLYYWLIIKNHNV